MSQQRVQFDDVKRAWMQIAFSGGNPTLDAIHKRIGYGSRSTIHKLRLKLLDELQERGVEILPARLPEALVPIIEEFWGHAIAQAGEAFSAERKEYQRDLEEGRAVRSEQQARITTLETELEQEKALTSELRQLATNLEREQERHQNLLRDAHAKISSLETTIQKNNEIHAMEMARLTQGFEHEQKEWKRDRNHLVNERDEAVNRAKFEIERADRNADLWLLEMDAERQAGKRLAESLRENINRLEQELHLTRQREQGLAQRNGKMEDRLYGTQEKLDELQAGYNAALEEGKQAANAYEKKIVELERTVSDLLARVAELQADKTDNSDQGTE